MENIIVFDPVPDLLQAHNIHLVADPGTEKLIILPAVLPCFMPGFLEPPRSLHNISLPLHLIFLLGSQSKRFNAGRLLMVVDGLPLPVRGFGSVLVPGLLLVSLVLLLPAEGGSAEGHLPVPAMAHNIACCLSDVLQFGCQGCLPIPIPYPLHLLLVRGMGDILGHGVVLLEDVADGLVGLASMGTRKLPHLQPIDQLHNILDPDPTLHQGVPMAMPHNILMMIIHMHIIGPFVHIKCRI